MDRRAFVLAATGSFALTRTVVAGTVAAASVRPALRLYAPADALTGMLRLQARLDGKDAPWWYFGRIYGLVPGQPPIPLVRYQGLEISRLTPAGNGEFAATGVTTSFFLDWSSRAPLEKFRNPVTGRVNDVRPNLIGGVSGKAAAFYSARGVRPGRVERVDWQPTGLSLAWDYHDATVWLSVDRTYPPGLPQPMGESSVARGLLSDLQDLSRDFVPAGFSSTYFAPWPAWMDMQDVPGHVVWHADGVKLETVERLPDPFRGWMLSRHPERLAAPPFA